MKVFFVISKNKEKAVLLKPTEKTLKHNKVNKLCSRLMWILLCDVHTNKCFPSIDY